MDPNLVTVPLLKDLTITNITENVKLINSQCGDPRFVYIMERVVQHLHDLARETRLSQDEWMEGIRFLTRVGQICSDVRQVCWRSLCSAAAMQFRPYIHLDLLLNLAGIHPPLRRLGLVVTRGQHRSP
jgi:hypothetical protein